MSVLILLIIGIALIFINIKAIKKENKVENFEDNFKNAESNIKNYDVEIGKLRKDFAETVLELQEEIEVLKEKIVQLEKVKNITKKNELVYDNKNIDVLVGEDSRKENKNVEDAAEVSDSKDKKVVKVKEMMDRGYSVDEISKELNIGKGEVLLIQKLYIK
ncbi:DUF6115 domain-containing protein [Clostridium hydrogenum]|uniref:DUF6115 domain-containing protein n=1 Tax=Clostridium hydrogenum TaxID=2855764 RepID=UPI001F47BB88|nr:hypothetical protein [Clostridium hydrogenum]